MPGIDKPTGRAVALVVLLIFAAAALRGYFPAVQPTPHEETTEHPGALMAVVALLAVSLGIVAIAIVARLRDPRTAAHSAGGLSETLGGRARRPGWRVLLMGLGVLVVWLLLVSLLSRFLGHHGLVAPAPGGESPTPPVENASSPPRQQGPHDSGGDMFGYLMASTLVLFLLVGAGAVVASRRLPRVAKPSLVIGDQPERSNPPAGPESLVRAAELGLAEIGDLSREPREAIIACYAAMERQLANVPQAVPQDFDTPTEVLARAVHHHALRADNAAGLVNLFAEARFSPHVMTEDHRAEAVQLLRLVLAELPPQAGGTPRCVA